jgi:hypothetical protein
MPSAPHRDEGLDILILARTDARQADSLDEALARISAFAEAGRSPAVACNPCGILSSGKSKAHMPRQPEEGHVIRHLPLQQGRGPP